MLLCPWDSFWQDYWSRLAFPPPRGSSWPSDEPVPPTLAGGFFTTMPLVLDHTVIMESLLYWAPSGPDFWLTTLHWPDMGGDWGLRKLRKWPTLGWSVVEQWLNLSGAHHQSTRVTPSRNLLVGGGVPGWSLRLEGSHRELMKTCVWRQI